MSAVTRQYCKSVSNKSLARGRLFSVWNCTHTSALRLHKTQSVFNKIRCYWKNIKLYPSLQAVFAF